MSTESNKILLNRFRDFINTANPNIANELISADASFYVPGRPDPLKGPAGYLEIIAMMRGGIPRHPVDDRRTH